jgi:5-methylcytosine-specific restriction protein A
MPKRPPTHKPLRINAPKHEPVAGASWRAGKSAAKQGYDARWRKSRAAFLKRHPLCVHCECDHRLTPATVVDHITPHRGDMLVFWDQGNWQPLCKMHHSRKTAKEDGAFGNSAKH